MKLWSANFAHLDQHWLSWQRPLSGRKMNEWLIKHSEAHIISHIYQSRKCGEGRSSEISCLQLKIDLKVQNKQKHNI